MMELYHGIEEYLQAAASGRILKRPSAVTLGKFDGIHLGHQKLLDRILERQKEGLTGIVFAIDSGKEKILSDQERTAFLDAYGIDVLIECPFSRHLMTTLPEDFASSILVQALQASYVAVGTDFRFGYQRRGDVATLRGLKDLCGFVTEAVEKAVYKGREISSTRIRDALEKGKMEEVAALLGRPYPIEGRVQTGRQIGRRIGIPTANLLPPPLKILPPDGVYASMALLEDGRRVPGVTNIGTNPTIRPDNPVRIETNLFDFAEDLYGSVLKIELVSRLRGEIPFQSLEDLTRQMQRDQAESRSRLSKKTI